MKFFFHDVEQQAEKKREEQIERCITYFYLTFPLTKVFQRQSNRKHFGRSTTFFPVTSLRSNHLLFFSFGRQKEYQNAGKISSSLSFQFHCVNKRKKKRGVFIQSVSFYHQLKNNEDGAFIP